MEEAMPARCGGAPPMIAAEAATMTMPRPAPARTRPGTTHAGLRPPPSRGDRARGQQQGEKDAEGAQEQAAADQRAYPGALEQAAGQHADGQGAGRERCHDEARVQGGQAQDELQALGEEQFGAGGGGHRLCGRDHPGEQAPVAEQGEVDQR